MSCRGVLGSLAALASCWLLAGAASDLHFFNPGSRRRSWRRTANAWLAHYSPACPRSRGSPPLPDPWTLDARPEVVAGYPSWKKTDRDNGCHTCGTQGKGINQGFSQLCTAGVTCTMRQCYSIVVVRSCSCSAVVHSTVH